MVTGAEGTAKYLRPHRLLGLENPRQTATRAASFHLPRIVLEWYSSGKEFMSVSNQVFDFPTTDCRGADNQCSTADNW